MSLELLISNICKRYDHTTVLTDCSFRFESGGIYVLTGPNGSGKSTFLRICALLETPDSGEVKYCSDGQLLAKNISLRRRITLLLPKIGVFNTSLFNNVAYGLKIRNLEKNSALRVAHALDFVGLLTKKNQQALTLSSGETQRLGIARALVVEPEVIFLDEPTASVDVRNTEIIEDIIRKIRKDGRSIIMTTHDMYQAKRIGGKLLVIKDGKITDHPG